MRQFQFGLLVAASLIIPAFGQAANWAPTCESKLERARKNGTDYKSTDECRAKTGEVMDKRMKDNRPYVWELKTRSTEDLCAFSSSLESINQGRCQKSVDSLKDLLEQRKNSRVERCGETTKQLEICRQCSVGTGGAGCKEADEKLLADFNSKQGIWKEKYRKVKAAIQDVEKIFTELSEAYAKNIQGLESNIAAEAQRVGETDPYRALNSVYQSQGSAEILQMVNEIQNASDISQSTVRKAETMRGMGPSEAVSGLAKAKAARLEMEKEMRDEDKLNQQLAKQKSVINESRMKTASIDPEASQSGLAGAGEGVGGAGTGAAGAAGGLTGLASAGGGGGSSAGSEGSGSETLLADASSGTYRPNGSSPSNYLLNGVTDPVGDANGTDIPEVASAEQASNGEGAINASSASRMPIRESLRAKLAAQLAQGKGGALEASQAAGGKAGSADAKSKVAAASAAPEMLAGFAPEDFSSSGDTFSMAQSETEAAVQEMMSEFEGGLEESSGNPGRHLASAEENFSAPEILAEDSSDLFLRTREFYERCQKRGCVTR